MWLCDLSNLIYVRLGELLGFLDQRSQVNGHQQQHIMNMIMHWITMLKQLLHSNGRVELYRFLKQVPGSRDE